MMGSVQSYFGSLCVKEKKQGKIYFCITCQLSMHHWHKAFDWHSKLLSAEIKISICFPAAALKHLNPTVALMFFSEEERYVRANDRPSNLSYNYAVRPHYWKYLHF